MTALLLIYSEDWTRYREQLHRPTSATASSCERVLKIGQHLMKLEARVQSLVFWLTLYVHLHFTLVQRHWQLATLILTKLRYSRSTFQQLNLLQLFLFLFPFQLSLLCFPVAWQLLAVILFDNFLVVQLARLVLHTRVIPRDDKHEQILSTELQPRQQWTRNVGQCPTWWPPCRMYVAPFVQCRKSLADAHY